MADGKVIVHEAEYSLNTKAEVVLGDQRWMLPAESVVFTKFADSNQVHISLILNEKNVEVIKSELTAEQERDQLRMEVNALKAEMNKA